MDNADPRALVSTLATIWMKYEPQRKAEADAVATTAKARDALAALNRERAAMGLAPVGEYQDQYGMQAMQQQGVWQIPSPKTWRDELDAALLQAVKTYCQESL